MLRFGLWGFRVEGSPAFDGSIAWCCGAAKDTLRSAPNPTNKNPNSRRCAVFPLISLSSSTVRSSWTVTSAPQTFLSATLILLKAISGANWETRNPPPQETSETGRPSLRHRWLRTWCGQGPVHAKDHATTTTRSLLIGNRTIRIPRIHHLHDHQLLFIFVFLISSVGSQFMASGCRAEIPRLGMQIPLIIHY